MVLTDVSGQWQGTLTDTNSGAPESPDKIVINLTQSANSINGTVHIESIAHPQYFIDFNVTGNSGTRVTFTEGSVTAHNDPVNFVGLPVPWHTFGTFSLTISSDQNSMSGVWSSFVIFGGVTVARASTTMPSVIALTSASLSSDLQDVKANYTITGADLPSSGTIDFYWASGPNLANKLGTTPAPAATAKAVGSYTASTSVASLGTRPANASYIIAVADSPNVDPNHAVVAIQMPGAKGTFAITSLSQHSFVASDSITLAASIGVPKAGVQVLWTVVGKGAAANIDGFPRNVVTTTDAKGQASFSFTPSDNPTFVSNRHKVWTKGSKTANPGISFNVTAATTLDGTKYSSSLSDTNVGPLTQDEIDRAREEYFDYGIPVPSRRAFVASLGPGYNTGNYNVQLNVNMKKHYDAVLAAYRGEMITVTISGKKYRVAIPKTAKIAINSGYRDPQHNKAVGSKHPDSKHTRGRALDLSPTSVRVTIRVNGRPRQVNLPLDQVLYPALYKAASTQGYSQAEIKGKKVPPGTLHEDHIHVQW